MLHSTWAYLAVVDTDDAANHLGDDNHVTEMGLDDGGLLIRGSLLLGLAELLDETHGLALQATVESAASTGMDEITEFLGGEVEKSVEITKTSEHLNVSLIVAIVRLGKQSRRSIRLLLEIMGCTYCSSSIPR